MAIHEELILCACSAYEEKYYLNPRYESLPVSVQEELKVMCVTYTMEVGGVLTLSFEPEGELYLSTTAKEDDFMYDEIGANLLIKELQKEKAELFEALELYYRTFFLKP